MKKKTAKKATTKKVTAKRFDNREEIYAYYEANGVEATLKKYQASNPGLTKRTLYNWKQAANREAKGKAVTSSSKPNKASKRGILATDKAQAIAFINQLELKDYQVLKIQLIDVE